MYFFLNKALRFSYVIYFSFDQTLVKWYTNRIFILYITKETFIKVYSCTIFSFCFLLLSLGYSLHAYSQEFNFVKGRGVNGGNAPLLFKILFFFGQKKRRKCIFRGILVLDEDITPPDSQIYVIGRLHPPCLIGRVTLLVKGYSLQLFYMSSITTFFVIFYIVVSCHSLYRWGIVGRSLIAGIAQTLLTNELLIFVRNHLPGYISENLSVLASWFNVQVELS